MRNAARPSREIPGAEPTGVRWLAVVTVLGAAACSTAATERAPRRPPPVAEGSADRDGDPPHAPRPPDAPPPERFPWQDTRDWYDRLRATPVGSTPCDFRARRPSVRGEVECLPPGGPARMAARGRIVGAPRAGQVQLELDLGTDDAITEQWVGALLDDTGRAISPWAHPERLGPHVAFLTVDIDAAAAEGRTRVGLTPGGADPGTPPPGDAAPGNPREAP